MKLLNQEKGKLLCEFFSHFYTQKYPSERQQMPYCGFYTYTKCSCLSTVQLLSLFRSTEFRMY